MKTRSLAVFLFFILVVAHLYGQDSLATMHLDEVVITGQFEPQSARKSVYSVRTIPMEVLQAKGATRLQDVLNTELNIRFAQDATLGGSNLSMQGLSGQNVKILIDGVPMVGRQGTSNEININQINVQSIERIEIVEGPMSTVYGADALAGVINIITKKNNAGKWDLTARVQEETAGDEYDANKGIHNQSISGGYSWNKFNARLDLTRNNFGGWQGGAEGRDKQWHPKDQDMIGGLVGYTTQAGNLYYRLDYLNEDIYNPGLFEGSQALDQNYITNRYMHQLQGAYRFSDRLSFTGAGSYTDYERRTQSATVSQSGDRRLALGEGLQDVTEFKGQTLRGTFQYKLNDKISFQPGFDLNFESGSGGRIQEGSQHIEDYAVFGSLEWTVAKGLQIRPGFRIIHNSVYDAPPVVPSINTKFTLSPRHDFRLSYGRGFRAPSIRELYFDFFDSNHSIEGNTNLEAELSHSFSGSWNWQTLDTDFLKWSVALGGFYNTVSDMIAFGQKPGNTLITTFLNIDKFKTKGLTINNKFKFNRLDAGLGFSYTGKFNQFDGGTNNFNDFLWSPEFISTLSYKMPKRGFIFSLYYKYTGISQFYELVLVDETETVQLAQISSFHWADLTVQKDLLPNLILTTGVRNLFDVKNINNTSISTGGAHTDGGARPVGYGRSYFLGLAYSISK